MRFLRQGESYKESVFGGLLGLCVGDALGVPVEFAPREALVQDPVTGYREYGTHNQPRGTWSDDSSLTFCTVAALVESDIDWNRPVTTDEVDWLCENIARNFVRWYRDGFWSAHGEVFDIGGTTRDAIERIISGEKTWLQTDMDENSNGNGSLMRILPLAFVLRYQDLQTRFEIIKKVSAITHGHIRSVIACHFYVEYAMNLMEGNICLDNTRVLLQDFYEKSDFKEELYHFHRIFHGDITASEIFSDGYVVHTLEAALYCLLSTESIDDALLKAVNLGDDTDTTAAVTGGLAGICYGFHSLDRDAHLRLLARQSDILSLINNFYRKVAVLNG